MTREEKFIIAIEKGYSCNPDTGQIFGIKGQEIGSSEGRGYIGIKIRHLKQCFNIKAHQFIWYWVHKECVTTIDHINLNKKDNSILNLRSITHQENMFNNNAKGYYYNKREKKWTSSIKVNYKRIELGTYKTEDEALKAYQEAKIKYHIINDTNQEE